MREVTIEVDGVEIRNDGVRLPFTHRFAKDFSAIGETRLCTIRPVGKLLQIRSVTCEDNEIQISTLTPNIVGPGETFELIATWAPNECSTPNG